MKIAVLLGGTSAERDISLVSGIAIAKALEENGHVVEAVDCAFGDKLIDYTGQDINKIISAIPSDIEKNKNELNRNVVKTVAYLLENKFDIAFIALHGGYGENGQLQALLELMHIKFTGSNSLSSALGMHKHYSKILFRNNGIPTVEGVTLKKGETVNSEQLSELGMPLIIKPNDQGSTVGLTKVESAEQIEKSLKIAFEYSELALIEKYIPGKELTVSILDQTPLPVIEIIPRSGFYDYEAKYQHGQTSYICPAELPEKLTTRLQNIALNAYHALSCRHYARVDFRMDESENIYCLEVNTLPGMTPTSLVPKAAKAIGISFNMLVEKIVETAVND